jgi:hypothetical protein
MAPRGICTLIKTVKRNGVDPRAMLTDTLRHQLPLERIRIFGLAAPLLLVHIKSPVIEQANRQPRATNDSANQTKIEGLPLPLTIN